MTKPTVYEANAYLYGFDNLIGKPAQLEYLPKRKSHKWRKASYWVPCYGQPNLDYAMRLLQQEGWYVIRFVAG
jgi:hypothetical protein